MIPLGKKALATETVVVMVLCLVVMVVLIAIFLKPANEAKNTVSSTIARERLQLCLAQGRQTALLSPASLQDADRDGYPDSCDVCIGGDDGLDANGDGVPDACEPAGTFFKPSDSVEKACNTAQGCSRSPCWEPKRKVCVLR